MSARRSSGRARQPRAKEERDDGRTLAPARADDDRRRGRPADARGITAAERGVALYQWRGSSLGSPSRLLLYHHDHRAAMRIIARCAAEIERLERIFALFRAESEIARLNRDGVLDGP